MADLAVRHAPTRQDETPLRALLRSRLWTAISGLTLLLLLGSAGYGLLGSLHYTGVLEPRLSRPWSALDCIYMTVITVSTIGYGEVFPLPDGATMDDFPLVRLYTIALIMIAMLWVAFSVSSATAFFVNGDLQRLLVKRRAMKDIARLRGHFIVCGCGVTGRVIMRELVDTGHTVVVLDEAEDHLAELGRQKGVIPLSGDATTDEVLLAAGIERAAGLAAALPNDKDNLFLVLSARQLCAGLRIISAASSFELRDKLLRAGANGVVSQSFIGGMRIASELLRPAVVSFLDLMLHRSGSPVRFAQVAVGAEWSGRTLADLDIPGTTGLPVLAVQPAPGAEFVFNPSPTQRLAAGMVLVTMGEVERVHELERRIGDRAGAAILGESAAGDVAAQEDAGGPGRLEP